MAQTSENGGTLRVADLSQRKVNRVTFEPDRDHIRALVDALDISDLRKVRFSVEIQSRGKRDWQLTGVLGATVIQPCVATLAPVTTRIDQAVTRLYLADGPVIPDGDEAEMPDDADTEALGEVIDLAALLHEELALALPDYPRAPDTTEVSSSVAPKGVAPLTDEDTKPFAGLAGLRDKLAKDRDED